MLIGRDHSSLQTDLAVPLHLETPYFLPPLSLYLSIPSSKRKATAETDKEDEVEGRVGQKRGSGERGGWKRGR